MKLRQFTLALLVSFGLFCVSCTKNETPPPPQSASPSNPTGVQSDTAETRGGTTNTVTGTNVGSGTTNAPGDPKGVKSDSHEGHNH